MSLADRLARRLARSGQKDPYEGLPTDELAEPVLPRWFVLLAVATVPVAVVLFVLAFFGFGRGETPVAERRPPPADGLTSDVGEVVVGDRDPVAHEPACDEVAGFQVAGTDLDRALLGAGLDALCDAPGPVRADVAMFAERRPVLRFAAFEATGVDVAASEEAGREEAGREEAGSGEAGSGEAGSGEGGREEAGGEQVVYVNARYSQTASDLIAPLVAYQAALARGDPASADTVVEARRVELAVCEAVVETPGRACADAEELLAADDPVADLRDAGFE